MSIFMFLILYPFVNLSIYGVLRGSGLLLSGVAPVFGLNSSIGEFAG
jgi:hypothetical protein